MSIRVLLLEDDTALAMGIEYSLKSEGYEVERISTYAEGLKWLERYDESSGDVAALFDVMLPDGNGFELLRKYRSAGVNIPVIFLTAVSDEGNIVQGLDIGADDYIAKPFRVRELISRLNAVIRRFYNSGQKRNTVCTGDVKENANDNEIISYRDLQINIRQASVTKLVSKLGACEKVNIELTSGEYRLLLHFVNNQGIVLERDRLLMRLFDNNGSFVDDNTLSVYMNRLREKIGDKDKSKPYIKTVRGIGYMMERENVC